jgi:hypothetical protein
MSLSNCGLAKGSSPDLFIQYLATDGGESTLGLQHLALLH